MFDGLLPEPHNKIITHLLFKCAHWHALAKLRMHTDITLDIMDSVTSELGNAFRQFQSKVCPAYDTRELLRETMARQRRQARKAGSTMGEKSSSGRRLAKGLNLNTYKFHSLGDYVESIRRYGTTDSYSTEVVSGCSYHHSSPSLNLIHRANSNIGFQKRGTVARIVSHFISKSPG